MRMKVLSAGIVPVFKNKFLILRVYNYWDFPKGVVEKGEEPLEAALRELTEETTIATAKFPWGKDFIETPPYDKGKVARYYLGEVNTQEVEIPINPESGKREHQEFRWVSFDEAMELLHPRLKRVLSWANEKIS